MDSLPLHILQTILSHLSTRTLLRLKSVCRLFRNIQDDPSFFPVHLSNNAVVEPPRILLLWQHQPGQPLSKEPDQYDHEDEKFLVSFAPGLRAKDALYSLRGSCCGLLCLEHFFDDVIFLFNPILREIISLPKPSTCIRKRTESGGVCKGEESMHSFGIGLHPATSKFKIVHVGWYWKGCQDLPRAEILEQGSRSWRKIKSAVPSYDFLSNVEPLYVDGVIHWVAEGHIVSFRVAEEEFVSTPLPAGKPCQLFNRLVDLGSRGLGLVESWGPTFTIFIWSLNKDGRWLREYTIDINDACRRYKIFRFGVVGCHGNGKFILQYNRNSSARSLFSYDPTSRAFQHEVEVPDGQFNGHLSLYSHVLNLKISLVSPIKLWNVENC